MKIVGNASFKKFRYSVNADLELSFYQWKTLLNVGGIQFFKKTCARVNFFLPGQTNFVQTVFFVQSFFFLVETVTEISGSQFFKDHILTNVTDFLTSGNHFFHFLQTAVNCYQWKQFILQLKHIFWSILHFG